MFERVLVANRGEIAVRICRTLRSLGIVSVVTVAIPDRGSLAARSADVAALLEGHSASDTYLDQDAIIAAALAHGCQAVHPGYGFLAENAEFAERCAQAALKFIGPTPETLRLLGDKSAARELAIRHDVPVVPGYDGPDNDDALAEAAAKIGFPVMIKARAGGGGRGMRVVASAGQLREAIGSARREAAAAFGDGSLLLEKALVDVHHVEIQVFADAHGNVIHLGERDCTVQRRHQKLIEEAPSPVVDDVLRERLTSSALTLARAAGYVNAGTFEFLVGRSNASGERPYWFIEANPRLQVEHPVTEAITGLDLVELQLRIAAGEPLPVTQEHVQFRGHAVESRIYAEDPANDYAPGAGRFEWYPGRLAGHRLDAGYASGDVVPPNFDSLIVKCIVRTDSRAQAIADSFQLISGQVFVGIPTNVALLAGILDSDPFRSATHSTEWLNEAQAKLLQAAEAPPEAWCAAAALRVFHHDRQVFGSAPASVYLQRAGVTRKVTLGRHSGALFAEYHGNTYGLVFRRGSDANLPSVTVDGVASSGYYDPPVLSVEVGERWYSFVVVPPPPLPRRARDAGAGAAAVEAPLAGTVSSLTVHPGDVVIAGQLLATLDAMKMEHRIHAPTAGTVVVVHVAAGDHVTQGQPLLELE